MCAVRSCDELDRRAWSQRRLADKALLGEATVFRLLKGDYSNKTLRKVEKALGLELDTPRKKSIGLMFRRSLPANHGMLFLYPKSEEIRMWMKNTFLPLDFLRLNQIRVRCQQRR